ncbi:MAG: molecular chaperone DnaK [Candidatus Omnitrophica bacterium]|nr:molecular chaperone DnaK [Candidatus Omnitrophota bacterium]
MAKAIGIDLGTSNSAAAVMEGGKPTIIPSAEGTSIGGKAFPSVVAFSKEGELLVGEPARRQAAINPDGTIQAAKRKIGTNHKYEISGKQYTPQQISAFILQKVKADAEAFLGDTVHDAVITVPAYFNDNQRQATKDAGAIAGLNVLRIINEPTAACLAYGLDKAGKEQIILVFDLGGGTLDVTLMDMWYDEEHKTSGFEVKSTSGDTALGGTDMDAILIDYVAKEFQKESGVDVRNDSMAVQRVREAVEKAKIELSTTLSTDLNLPYLTADSTGPKHLALNMTRAKLEDLVRPVVNKCRGPIEQALRDAGLTADQVHRIILVGGPTRMPIIQHFVEEVVGKKVERGVDPMECVAQGAAIQAAALKGEVQDIQLLDVTPLSVGIETMGQVLTKLIERNTTIPTRKSQIFSTAADNQTSVTVRVLQGERSMANDNTELGRFDLVGIPPAPRGVPQIEVTFDIDADGIMHVSAKDLGTQKEQSIRVTAPDKLSKDEIDRMVKEAEQFADEDAKKKELAEVRNQAEALVYSTEKSVQEHGDKLEAVDKSNIEEKIKALREVLDSGDVSKIQKANEALAQASHKLAEILYKDAAAQQGAQGAQQAGSHSEGTTGTGAGSTQKDEDGQDVVDAEFKVEDDKS